MRTRFVVVTVIVLGAAAVAVLLFIRPGGFSARVSPSAPERLLATAVRRLAVPRSGRDALNPIPFSRDVRAQGRAHFADHDAFNGSASCTQGVAMTRLIALVGALTLVGTAAFAHGGNEHVRGVVTTVSAQSVTVQTADKTPNTLTLTDKTTFKQAGKAAQLSDVHVGDRVVIDVPEKTTTALLIQIGAAPKTTARK